MKKNKIIHWPRRVMPEPEIHKLEGEFFHDNMDVFAGHHDYRPDRVTVSPMDRVSSSAYLNYTFEGDANSYIDQHAYGLPGDFAEDAGW